MATVKLHETTKQYDDGIIGAEDVSLDIEDGEFLILVGPSGCGKTTMVDRWFGRVLDTLDEEGLWDESLE